ncbi:MAG: molybdate ABC transporter substrate-binding protein [Nitrososphaerota archaeon]|jgi:molybdate transport system substrate-binding protein|nr:molybdate ABC transporter substrate-binding protein [Nitrososphaerota archaeon]
MNTKYLAIILIAVIAAASVIGYVAYSGTLNPPTELRVSIASSLIHVVEDMVPQFEKDNNVKIILNSDSSSTLYTQITAGSPADVYLSADQKWTKQLLTNSPGLLHDRYENFTTNSIEVILSPGNPANIKTLSDLAKPGVKLVLAAPSVPAGSYANSTIWKIDSAWGNPSSPQYDTSGAYKNFNTSIYQNVVSYENSVEQVVGKVSLDIGTADAGIVFVSDGVYGTNTGAQVTFIQIPTDVNTRGTYGIGVVGSTQQPELAQKFMDYWLSNTGKEQLTKYGFNS